MQGEAKTITIAIPSRGCSHSVNVVPGVKAKDILSDLGLTETHYLSRRLAGRPIGHRASIFGQVEDSAVLFACQQVTTTQMDLPLDSFSLSG